MAGWRQIPLSAVVVHGISPIRKLCVLRFRMPFSVTVVFLRCSVSVRQTFRTAVYGPVRTVVWQESVGDHRPYADRCGGRWEPNHGNFLPGTKAETPDTAKDFPTGQSRQRSTLPNGINVVRVTEHRFTVSAFNVVHHVNNKTFKVFCHPNGGPTVKSSFTWQRRQADGGAYLSPRD